jgi:hypothetical protein
MFACPDVGLSPFWKDVMWAARAAKMGYQLKVGKGTQTKFWEGHWFGNCSLACNSGILYIIANEHNVSIVKVWDGTKLKIPFMRSVDQLMMNMWYELVSIAESLHLNDEDDSIILKFEAKATYSVSSMYDIINFRGIIPVHIPSVWKLNVPPRLHVFLWLIANNKLLTRDNRVK